ncbi:MAG: hypothetical protein JST89_16870 [Cyanobacteria bacterium SZAS-4]|nr:hypothetical protein [Cyanobacteria bacterium SZAS-4]
MNKAKPTYQLGAAQFLLTHADPEFSQVLDRLLPRSHAPNSVQTTVCDIQMGLSFDIAEVLRQIIAQHVGCLLIQSASMVSPQGRRVLISGAPGSGKTTLSIALALRHGWKVIADDMTIINTRDNKIIGFAAPFNLFPGTRKLLSEIGIALPGFILREWYPLSTFTAEPSYEARFETWLHLDQSPDMGEFSCTQISKSDQTRKILSTSNLLSVRGTDRFMECVPESHCFSFRGGSLSERLEKTLELAL